MKYLIQENLFKEYSHEFLISTLDRFKLDYTLFSFVPFANGFVERLSPESTDFKDILPTSEPTWVWGAIKAAHIAKGYGFNPGSMFNDNHDYSVYSKYYKDNMLNWESEIIKFGEPLPEWLPFIFFSRPTKDTKSYSGKIFTKDSWKESVDTSLTNGHNHGLDVNTEVIVSSVKAIQTEVRNWCIKGKIVTSSVYKRGDLVVYDSNVDQDMIDYAQDMVDLYQPAEAFVIDTCRTEHGLKIVEINCINSAGFYKADLQKLISSIESNFNNG